MRMNAAEELERIRPTLPERSQKILELPKIKDITTSSLRT
jgi:hypothetical protein